MLTNQTKYIQLNSILKRTQRPENLNYNHFKQKRKKLNPNNNQHSLQNYSKLVENRDELKNSSISIFQIEKVKRTQN